MPVTTRPWDAAEFLADDQDIRHYLEAAFEDGDPVLIREAFKTYFEGAEIGEDVDPARMYEIKSEFDADGIYVIADLERFSAVYFKPQPRFQLQLNVENLFNKKYYASAHSNDNIAPGSPRALRMTALWRF